MWVKNWVVFTKKPFGNANQVVEYLGRYTHKIAISNNRIHEIDHKNVIFNYKDFRQNGFNKQMRHTHQEFIRRFALHILPKCFVKTRYYGFLSNIPRKTGQAWKREKLKNLQQSLQLQPQIIVAKESKIRKCQCCKTGNLQKTSLKNKYFE